VTLDDRYRQAIQEAVTALTATRPTELGRPVPTCPQWDLEALLGHLGTIHRWAARLLLAGPGERVRRRDVDAPPPGAAVLAWLDESSQMALAALDHADLGRPVQTWAGKQPARWWLRRLAHESSMHAWDGMNATSRRFAVEPELAVDAINETFELFLPVLFRHDVFAAAGETMHLHATDTDGEWLVTFEPDIVRVERTHAKGDVAVRGPAFDLLLLLWSRREIDELEAFGDRTIIARFADAADF
jgi:uncharacterized protein (TIGR03083 family)